MQPDRIPAPQVLACSARPFCELPVGNVPGRGANVAAPRTTSTHTPEGPMRVFRPAFAAGLVAAAAACADQTQAPVTAPELPGASAVAPVLSAAPGKGIRDEYIVVLREGANPRSVAAITGASPRHVYTAALTGFSATLNYGQLNALQHNPAVEYIEQDSEVQVSATQSGATWGIDRIDQRSLPLNSSYTYTPTGAGVRAYVVDTGIRTTHGDFGGRASMGWDGIGDGSQDCNGHGTHVAGSIGSATYGVAKGVTLVGVRVFGCGSSGSTSTIIAGIDWVAANAVKPAVANMSLGGGASTAMDDAVQRLINSGVIAVVAAGNENQNACNVSPARLAAAITVGATSRTDARWVWNSYQGSNFGSCVDLFAPGDEITSTWISSNTSINTITGTSMAAPHVAGVVALHLQGTPSATQSAVSTLLINTSTTGKVTSVGTGSPNRLLFSPLTVDGGTTPPPSGGTTYTGSLSGTGDSDIHVNGTYYQSTVAGTHKGVLDGPTGADFDLLLYRWNGSAWAIVARGETSSPDETITYSGTAGYYYWKVLSYSGSGSYTFTLTKP